MSVILNVAFVGAFIATLVPLRIRVLISVKTQFSDQVKIKDTSIKGMLECFNILYQTLLECFNGTTISSFYLIFIFPCSVFAPFSRFIFDVYPVILVLYLNDTKFVMGSAL